MSCCNHNHEKFYITTAIAYASGKPHIGNTYEVIMTDAVARRKRQEGYDVFFMTGTDEHGMKIEDKAKAKGVTPMKTTSPMDTKEAHLCLFFANADLSKIHRQNIPEIRLS